ncbi:MAG TPA: transglutaminase-like cysteine peptidase [Methylocella sp.]|nr:transglutaminase-like cysteine peptidase [Methylocella sp.]
MVERRGWKFDASQGVAILPLIAALVSGSAVLAAPGVTGVKDKSNAAIASFAPVGGPVATPFGWTDFCRRYQGECGGGPLAAADISYETKTVKEISRVNHKVNAEIRPLSDIEHWGVIDQWDYPPDGRGDCEDYALLKRKLLIDEGFPRQALLMTIVKDENSEGHAVLTVKTSAGDFILDNRNDELKLWSETGYHFVKRQSQLDQNIWLQIGGPTAVPEFVSK